MKQTHKLTLSALFCTIALILSYVESLIPPFFAVPGIKLGLSNIISVYLLYTLGFNYALTVALLRVALSSLLFGTTLTLAYSLAGAMLSILLMYLFKRLSIFSEVGVSIIGGVSHNAAQVTVAAIIMQTNQIVYYLPPLLISGTVTGAVIGISGALLIKKLRFKERF